MKLAMIQMHVHEDADRNICNAVSHIKHAGAQGADIVVLPEMFSCPYQAKNFPVYAQPEGGEHWRRMAAAARESNIWIIAGTMPERDDGGKVYNTAYVFNPIGEQAAKHRKMHLFDIAVEGGQHFRESDTLTAGNDVTVFDTEFGLIGLGICYDIRFPELARLMSDRGANVIVYPGAFNMTTGPAHWELSFRARALDNQVYAVGVAPARDVNGVYVSYANSIVTSPWGEVVARMDEGEGIALADLDLSRVEKIRRELPLLAHRRTDLYRLEERNSR